MNMKEEREQEGQFQLPSDRVRVKQTFTLSYMAHGETRSNIALSVLCCQEVTPRMMNE